MCQRQGKRACFSVVGHLPSSGEALNSSTGPGRKEGKGDGKGSLAYVR